MRCRFTIKFPPESSQIPLTYHLIKDYDFMVNILRATISGEQEGRLLMEVEAEPDKLEQGLAFLKSHNVTIIPLNQQITVEQDRCIHCGACTAVCLSGALSLDRDNWQLVFDSEKCVMCGLCVSACPLRLIRAEFK
jgi:ferredoxin